MARGVTDSVGVEPSGVTFPVISPAPLAIPQSQGDALAEPDAVKRRPGGTAIFGAGGDAQNTFRVETTQEGQRLDAFGNVVTGSAGLTSQAFGIVAKGDEAKAAAYEAAQAEKNSVGAQLAEVVKPFKNLAAGILNGIVPGGNLGDANDPLRSIGEIVAGVTPLGIVANKIESLAPVAKAIEKVEKLTDQATMGLSLNTLISGANSFLSSPLGQIAGQFVTPATGTKAPGVPLQPVVPQTYIPGFNAGVGYGPGASVVNPDPNLLTFGGPVGQIYNPAGTTTTASTPNTDAGVNPLVWIGLAIAAFFMLKR